MRLETYRVFNAAAVMWSIALLVATFEVSRPHASNYLTPADVVALAVYGAGSIICHQLPERSFQLRSTEMPVCARCTGIYAGAAIAVVLLGISGVVDSAFATTRNHKGGEGHKGQSTRFALCSFSPPWLQTWNRGWFRGSGSPRPGGAAMRLSADVVRRTLCVAALPTLATLVFEWSTGEVPANWVRAAAGMPLGGAVAWAIESVMDVK
jgi:hypothetical protein